MYIWFASKLLSFTKHTLEMKTMLFSFTVKKKKERNLLDQEQIANVKDKINVKNDICNDLAIPW